MVKKNYNLKQRDEERELREIIEIAQLAKSSREVAQPFEDKTRPIVESKDYGQEVKVMHFTH